MRHSVGACAVLLAILAGCGTVPLGSIPQLARIDARTTDLERLRVAVDVPHGIQVRTGGVKLDAILEIEGEADTQQSFILIEAAGNEGPPASTSDRTVLTFRLPSEQVQRFEALRSRVTRAKAERRKGSLSLGIATDEFCASRALSHGPLRITTLLKTSETGKWVVASKDFDFRDAALAASTVGELTACSSAQ